MMSDVNKVIKAYETIKAFLEIPDIFFVNIDRQLRTLLWNKINGQIKNNEAEE